MWDVKVTTEAYRTLKKMSADLKLKRHEVIDLLINVYYEANRKEELLEDEFEGAPDQDASDVPESKVDEESTDGTKADEDDAPAAAEPAPVKQKGAKKG